MTERTTPIILGQFLEGINESAGAARHLLHHQQRSNWFHVVSILEAVHRMIVAEVVDPLLTPVPKPYKKKKTII